MKSILAVFFVTVVAVSAQAQFPERVALSSQNELLAQYELFSSAAPNTATNTPSFDRKFFAIEEPKVGSKKSGVLAAGLSLILPGLGEYYVGDQIWRGIALTVTEGGLWYGRLHWNARGDDSLVAFHTWADSLWTPQRYSDYLNSLFDPTLGKKLITDPNDFSQINRAEDILDSTGHQNFTHRLPSRGSQQYYELISKYIQFTPGWVDDVDHVPEHSKDLERHAEMRETMNHQYAVADYFMYGIILNHILSAVDAALLARDHNKAITLHGELQQKQYPDGQFGYIPTARIEYRF